jgi:hypothetical protein
MLLSILALPVGGGFVPAFVGLIASAAAARINRPLPGWWERLPRNVLRPLAALWPWPLVGLVAWAPGSWLLGYFFNEFMLNLGFVLFFCCGLGLPLLVMMSALARDR